jgi:hypothetical protein
VEKLQGDPNFVKICPTVTTGDMNGTCVCSYLGGGSGGSGLSGLGVPGVRGDRGLVEGSELSRSKFERRGLDGEGEVRRKYSAGPDLGPDPGLGVIGLGVGVEVEGIRPDLMRAECRPKFG